MLTARSDVPQLPLRSPLPGRLAVAIAGWCVVVAACSAALHLWSRQPGGSDSPPAVMPQSLHHYQTPGRPTLLVALHPRCPCSRATVANLQRALRAPDRRCTVVAFIYAPRGEVWTDTDLVARLSSLPDLQKVIDPEGAAAASLGMHTSGHVVAYNDAGVLAFTGGVTPSRGEEGDCPSLDALIGAITPSGDPATSQSGFAGASVFGCPLCNQTQTDTRPALAESRR
ncbi:MAG TPA: hypothetical protein VFF65_05335 [Phycisphaerales bacterium]|nr:hypothetical protein [Phycisphaerales bacterium]